MKKVVISIILIIVIIAIILLVIFLNNKPKTVVEETFYITNDAIYEKTGKINVNGIKANLEKINSVFKNNLENMNVYFTIIPDKTYYLENKLDTEFKEIKNNVQENLNPNIEFFDISNKLSLEDYYRTDMHWKQENLGEVIETIRNELDLKREDINYEQKTLGEFYGTYYKEIESNISPDELIYLANNNIENCTVYVEETKTNEKVYSIEKYEESGNKYDIFLSGASAIEIITNNNADTDKKLIMFRDSFGSSLAPLLINDYKEIVLIDLRYVNYSILENYIDFSNYDNQDVLFIYSSRVINRSGIFR